jgi:hypothetical protein
VKNRAIAALLAGCLATTGTPGLANSLRTGPRPAVSLDSAVYIEHAAADNAGGLTRSLQLADRLSRGDRIVTILTWQKLSGTGGFTVVNPLPRKVAYQGSARDDEQVSVDGGRSWGRLGELNIGTRLATAEDVTHVRWHVGPRQAALGQGRIAYSAIVR